MCLILYAQGPKQIKAARAWLTTENKATTWAENHDGASVLFSEKGGKTHIRRGLMDQAALDKSLDWGLSLKLSRLAIHWRFATSGGTLPGLTHAFPVEAGWIMHNGVLPLRGGTDESDTAVLARVGADWDYKSWHDIWPILCRMGDRILMVPKDQSMPALMAGQWVKAHGVLFSHTVDRTVSLFDLDGAWNNRVGVSRTYAPLAQSPSKQEREAWKEWLASDRRGDGD